MLNWKSSHRKAGFLAHLGEGKKAAKLEKLRLHLTWQIGPWVGSSFCPSQSSLLSPVLNQLCHHLPSTLFLYSGSESNRKLGLKTCISKMGKPRRTRWLKKKNTFDSKEHLIHLNALPSRSHLLKRGLFPRTHKLSFLLQQSL